MAIDIPAWEPLHTLLLACDEYDLHIGKRSVLRRPARSYIESGSLQFEIRGGSLAEIVSDPLDLTSPGLVTRALISCASARPVTAATLKIAGGTR